jgi:NADP-dependent 3-hydroxy acid dehydrogenase YdfG
MGSGAWPRARHVACVRRVESGLLRVLISGAGSGVGLACARAFAERGAELILTDVDAAALEQATRELGAFARTCDVCCEASVGAFSADVLRMVSSVDVLINAAGRRYVRTLGMMRMTRAFLPAMIAERTETDVINIAAVGGLVPGASQFPYAASQEAFDRLSEALAFEVRGTNVTITSIVPNTRRTGTGDCTGQADRSFPALPYTYRLESFDPQGVAGQIIAAVQRGSDVSDTYRPAASGC